MKTFYMLVVLLMISSLRCSSNEDSNEKFSLLLEQNADVNELISSKNFGRIYDKILETKKMKLTKRILPSKASFIKRYIAPEPVVSNLKYLSYSSINDTIITSNIISTTVKIDTMGIDISAIDTVYHFWKYFEGNWYLLNIFQGINEERLQDITFKDNIKMLKSH